MAASDAFYIELRDETVIPLLEEFGTTYTVRADSTYDPSTGDTTLGATRTVKGVIADESMTKGLLVNAGAEASENTWIGRKNALLDPTVAFAPNEEIQINGQWYPSSKVQPLQPGDIIVMYIVDLTR